MSMVGDAISHAVLPGIVIAYLVAGSRSSVILLLGAALFGLITTFLIEFFYKRVRIQSDASIGITFTWLFAIGVILVSVFSGNVDLDQECVLYGDIAYVPFDLWYVGDTSLGPAPVWLQAMNLFVIVIVLKLGYRGFLITGFDSPFAEGLGIRTGNWHYLLMGMVSFTVVLAFNAVGAILVVAFLVIPPSTAFLLSREMKTMIVLTVIFGILAAVAGFFLATLWKASISGAMAFTAGVVFFLVLIYQRIRQTHGNKALISDQAT
jgi:manganese/zinc/iron transport system permease protein